MQTLDKDNPLCFDRIDSPVGQIYLILHQGALVAVSFDKPHYKLCRAGDDIKNEMKEYFSGYRREFSIEFKLNTGTAFEREVWNALRDIPYGQTRSYKWMAEHINRPNGFRAVGQALAKNPLPIILPCHRVVESQGSLGGYTPGIEIKRRLLSMEYYNCTSGKS